MYTKSTPSRVISVLLAFVLAFTLIPASSFAYGEQTNLPESQPAAQTEDVGPDASSEPDSEADTSEAQDTEHPQENASNNGSMVGQEDQTNESGAQPAVLPDVETVTTSVSLDGEVASVLTYDGLVYRLTDPATAQVALVGWSGNLRENLAIPETIMVGNDSYSVTAIRSLKTWEQAPNTADQFTELYAESEKTPLVKAIDIPASINSIEASFFQQFPKAMRISVSSNNATYQSFNGMLFDKQLTTLLAVPEGKEGSAVLPSTVSSVSAAMFVRSTKLTSIEISSEGTSSIFGTENGVLYNADKTVLIAAPAGLGTSVNIAETCRTLSAGAFLGNSQIRTIHSSSVLERIDGAESEQSLAVFEGGVVANATVLVADDTTRAVWEKAGFSHFSEPISVGETIPPETGESGLSYRVLDALTLEVLWSGEATAPAQVEIPSTVEIAGMPYTVSAIADNGFAGQPNLEQIVLPDSITAIGNSAFEGVTALSIVDIPGTTTTIGEKAFAGCVALSAVSFEEGVCTIGARAFENTAVETVALPASIRTIYTGAFANCGSLQTVLTFDTNTDVASDVLEGCSGVNVYVPLREDAQYGWNVGAPVAGNHVLPYGVKTSPTPLYLQIEGTASVFEGGYVEAPGDISVSFSYREPVSVSTDGMVTAKELGTTAITTTLSFDDIELASSTTTAVVSLLPAMEIVSSDKATDSTTASNQAQEGSEEVEAANGETEVSLESEESELSNLIQGETAIEPATTAADTEQEITVAPIQPYVTTGFARTMARATNLQADTAQYYINFNAMGGTLAGGPLYNMVIGDTRTISASASKTGYNFLGWSTSSTNLHPSYTTNSQVTLNSTLTALADSNGCITMYAVYQAKTYSLRFNANGGSALNIAPEEVSYDKPYFSTASITPKRDNWQFKGWAYTSDAATAVWAPSSTFRLDENAVAVGDAHGNLITLYAVWQHDSVTIKFDCTGGKPNTGLVERSLKNDEGFQFTKDDYAIRYGYEFIGWGLTKESSDYYPEVVYPGSNFILTADIIDTYVNSATNTLTLYAIWNAEGTEYTVAFNNMGGTGISSLNVVQRNRITYVEPPTPPAGNWHFAGYGPTAPSAMAGQTPELFIDSDGYGTELSQARQPSILYAYWYKDVRLIENGGTVQTGGVVFTKALRNAPLGISLKADSQFACDNEFAALFPEKNAPGSSLNGSNWAPTLNHHIFKGYAATETGGTLYIDENGQPTSELFTSSDSVVYAQWEKIPTFVVHLNPMGGVQLTADTFVVDNGEVCDFLLDSSDGSSTTQVPIPTKTNCTFNGYYYQDSGAPVLYAKESRGYLVAVRDNWASHDEDITLYASWTQESTSSHTLTLNPNGGTQSGTTTFSFTDDAAPSITLSNGNMVPIPTRSGYRFDGYWCTYGTETYVLVEESTRYPGYLSLVTGNWVNKRFADLTVHAHWTEIVTETRVYQWVDGDGNVLKTDTVEAGMPLPTYSGPDPTKTPSVGYTYTWTGEWTCMPSIEEGIYGVFTPEFRQTARTYQVTLNANGGTIAANANVTSYTYTESGSSAILPTEGQVAKDGYTFAGWYEDAGFTGIPVTAIPARTFGEKYYWAKWNEDIEMRTYQWVDGDGNLLKTEQVPADQTPTYSGPDPTKTATAEYLYNWTGEWTCAPSEDEGIYGVYTPTFTREPRTYKVTLNTNGGTIASGADVTSYRYTEGGYSVDLPKANQITKAGYTFAGWYEDASFSGNAVSVVPARATGDKTYWAKWETAVVMRTYQWIDGDGNVLKTEQFASDQTPVYSGSNPTKTATVEYTYTWTGEWTYASGTGDVYGTYTATFTPVARTYKVTLNTNGGTLASGANIDSYTYRAEGASITLPTAAQISKTNYTFAGWYEDAGFSGSAVTAIPPRTTGDKTYWAKWEAAVSGYDVQHYCQNVEGNGYTLVDTDARTGNAGDTVTAVARAFTGFHENTSAPDRVASGTLPSSGRLTLKLYYDRDVYDVTFITGTSQTIVAQSVRYGAKAVEPTNPTRAGYTFQGWMTGSTTGSAYDFNSAVTAPVALYAAWNANPYTITWNANGGTFSGGAAQQTTTVLHGQPTTTEGVDEPQRTGYGFAGWAANDSSTTQATFPQATTGAATYYAIWSANAVQYTVRYVSTEGASIRQEKTLSNTVGTTVSETAPAITGYTLTGTGVQSLTLQANSSANIITFTYEANTTTVTFAGEGTGGMMGKTITYTYGKRIPTLPDTTVPTRNGYTFAGWKTSEGKLHYAADGTPELSGMWTGTQSAITLNADWTANTYTLRYNPGEGTGVAYSKKIAYAQGGVFDTFAASGFKPPENCTFAGWMVGSTIYQPGMRADSLTTLDGAVFAVTAQWTRSAYRIVWQGAGGTFGTDSATGNPITEVVANHAKGSSITRPANPQRAGYVFDGWALNGTKVEPDATASRDVTYTALWTQPVFALTFKGGAEGAAYTDTYCGSLPTHANMTAAQTAAGFNVAGYLYYNTTEHSVQMLVKYGATGQTVPAISNLYRLDGASAAGVWQLTGQAISGMTWTPGREIAGDAVFAALYAQGAGRMLYAQFTPHMDVTAPLSVSMDIALENGTVEVKSTSNQGDASYFSSASAGDIVIKDLSESYADGISRDQFIQNARDVFGEGAYAGVSLTVSDSPWRASRIYDFDLASRHTTVPANPFVIPAGSKRVDVYYGLRGVSLAGISGDVVGKKIANLTYTVALKDNTRA